MNSPLPPHLNVPPPVPVTKPGVVRWYRPWCVLFVVVWLGMVVYSVLKAQGAIEDVGPLMEILVKDDKAARDELLAEGRQDAIGVAVIAGIAAAFYVFAACVPRKPWGWVIAIVAIVGSIFPFCIPAAGAIPLLVFWMKPEAKRYFGKPLVNR